MPPGPPKLPRVKLPANPLEPLREIVREGRERIEKAGSDIRSIAEELHSTTADTTSTIQSTEKAPQIEPQSVSQYSLPTTEETTRELKRRLAKELYRAQLDLSAKLRIAGKPCDCLESKHTLGLEATAEELIASEPDNAVYFEILEWLKRNRSKVTIEAISSGRYDNEYPVMAAEFREFRKRIMGTTVLTAMVEPEEQISLQDAKKMAAEEAAKEVEARWRKEELKNANSRPY